MKVDVEPKPVKPNKIILELTIREALSLSGLLQSYQSRTSSFYNSWYATDLAKPLDALLKSALKGCTE